MLIVCLIILTELTKIIITQEYNSGISTERKELEPDTTVGNSNNRKFVRIRCKFCFIPTI
jgi:hypothetical protein